MCGSGLGDELFLVSLNVAGLSTKLTCTTSMLTQSIKKKIKNKK